MIYRAQNYTLVFMQSLSPAFYRVQYAHEILNTEWVNIYSII